MSGCPLAPPPCHPRGLTPGLCTPPREDPMKRLCAQDEGAAPCPCLRPRRKPQHPPPHGPERPLRAPVRNGGPRPLPGPLTKCKDDPSRRSGAQRPEIPAHFPASGQSFWRTQASPKCGADSAHPAPPTSPATPGALGPSSRVPALPNAPLQWLSRHSGRPPCPRRQDSHLAS